MIFGWMAGAESRSLENPAVSLSSPEAYDLFTSGGVEVSPDSAMRLAAVYSCVYVLASSWAQLPLSVLRKVDGRIEAGTDHAAHYLLHDAPNDWQTSYKWRETKQAHVATRGNGFSELIRNGRGELQALELCDPIKTDLVRLSGNRWVYQVRDEDGKPRAVQPVDMLHIRALGADGRMGISPIRQHAETIGLGLAAQRYGKAFFDGGGRATGLVTVKGSALEQKSWDRLKEVWRGAAAALRSSENKTLLLPAELDYKALTIAPEDAQFLDTRKMTRSEIAGIFNIPPHLVGDLEKATFSNISEQAIQFVRHTMMPWVVNWEQEINRRVFTPAERRAGYYVKANLAGLLRGTPKERAEFYRAAINDGWMDRNEVRALEDLNPRTGLDQMLVSVNAQLAEQLGKDPAA